LRKLLLSFAIGALAIGALNLGALRAVPPPNLDRALAAQRVLVQKQPTAEHWNDLGNLLQLGGHDDEARDAYEKALQLDPKLATAHYNLALLLLQSGSSRQALDHLRKVTELDEKNAWAWFQIGALYEARGDRGPAIRAYARAFALDPKLSFTDVNPQIVDSKLVTESLLMAERERSTSSGAARQYEEPRRITKLLLPQMPATAATPAAKPAPSAVPATPAQAAKPGAVLGPQDLRHGAPGGVTGTARNPYANQQPQQQPNGEPSYGELLRQRLLEQQQEQEEQQQEQPQQPAQEAQPGTVGGSGVPGVGVPGIYVPQPRSSGQLEQRLDLPGQHTAPAPQQPAR
jgi:tetratricopeptide (TPR) repeat protein